ncbi:hypothetical protein EON83_01675 [bacterium]|nr:MAG: hypothetical protein EON83_01675 [bacterium]
MRTDRPNLRNQHRLGAKTMHDTTAMSRSLNFRGALSAILLFVLALGCFSTHVEAAPLGWQPSRTWVFAASLVQFQHKEMFGSFPTENRRDDQLIQFFRGHGVPNNHIVYCKDKVVSLRSIQTVFKFLLQKAAPGDTLFFYYQGHGYRSESKTNPDAFFAAYDTADEKIGGWSVNSITATIDRYFKGGRAILTADCCYSGFLAETVKRNRGRIQYACLTSSSARETSTGHWTFSECLLDALNGAPFIDANADGMISVGELAVHAHDDMAIAEEQHSAFALSGGFLAATVLAVSKPRPCAPIGQRVKAKQNGVWYAARVVATKLGQLLVDYIGYDEDDEWFNADDANQIQLLSSQPALNAKLQFAVGNAVEVKWQGDWYAAKVLKVDNGVYFIHYIEDDSSWDEWVSSKRIRTPQQ